MVRVGMSISVCSIYIYTVGILYVVGSSRKVRLGEKKTCTLELTRVYETSSSENVKGQKKTKDD